MPGAPDIDTPITIQHLNLDTIHHSNTNFSNWTLRNDIIQNQQTILPLSSPVVLHSPEDLDYVHARYDALRNHIITQPHGHYLFQTAASTEATKNAITLCLLKNDPQLGDISVEPLWNLEAPNLPEQTTLLESQLHPSVVEVTSASTNIPDDDKNDSSGKLDNPVVLLASTGNGDIRALVRTTNDSSNYSTSTEVVYPIRPHPPLQGVRPIHLEAAMSLPDDNILVVCWTVGHHTQNNINDTNGTSSNSSGVIPTAAARRPAVCEVYAVVLKLTASLEVVRVDLLQRSSMAPHAVLTNPFSYSILLALDPLNDALQQQQNIAGSATVDDSDDPVSPRTLQLAVDRLEQYTSDTLVTDGNVREGFSDLFHETGPDNVGGMGTEPTCALMVYTVDGVQVPRVVGHISCLPHRLLSAQLHQDGSSSGSLALGLTDDVDCAVLKISTGGDKFESDEKEQGKMVRDDGTTPLHFESLDTAGFQVVYESSIPALAYIAAGKLAKRFLLLTPHRPSSSSSLQIAAALIETKNYAYVYKRTGLEDRLGYQQILDTATNEAVESSDSSNTVVLGAVLLDSDGDSTAGGVGDGKGEGSTTKLVLLSRDNLLIFSSAPFPPHEFHRKS